MSLKLNLGCGHAKVDGYVNIDINPQICPDKVLDFTAGLLPYETGSVEEVICIHAIEHVKAESHSMVIGEINRVLKMGGIMILAYPDAEKCLKNCLENKQGMRSYWIDTLLGRGNTIWDLHRSMIFTSDFIHFLRELGFGKLKVMEEALQSHNTVIQAEKTFQVAEMSDLLTKELSLK